MQQTRRGDIRTGRATVLGQDAGGRTLDGRVQRLGATGDIGHAHPVPDRSLPHQLDVQVGTGLDEATVGVDQLHDGLRSSTSKARQTLLRLDPEDIRSS